MNRRDGIAPLLSKRNKKEEEKQSLYRFDSEMEVRHRVTASMLSTASELADKVRQMYVQHIESSLDQKIPYDSFVPCGCIIAVSCAALR